LEIKPEILHKYTPSPAWPRIGIASAKPSTARERVSPSNDVHAVPIAAMPSLGVHQAALRKIQIINIFFVQF
jgi:hypothetical protein